MCPPVDPGPAAAVELALRGRLLLLLLLRLLLRTTGLDISSSVRAGGGWAAPCSRRR
jgi:hypothetical protein